MPMNTHAYEDLGDELFQMLCQALLVRETPGVQCYPVAMPDGGRDATAQEPGAKGFTVFQVKFSRDPAKLKDPVEWIKKAVEGEVPKVKELVARGARRFVLITNVQGTSHLDGGSMDLVSSLLGEVMPVPSECWWRDSLDRRLENAWDLKLRYPAVLKGPDVVRLAWERATVGDSQNRRKNALNGYLSIHCKEESTVRFKQVELVSTALLDLFIDVPTEIGRTRTRGRRKVLAAYGNAAKRIVSFHQNQSDKPNWIENRFVEGPDGIIYSSSSDGSIQPLSLGGADLLTDPQFVEDFPWVVIEGAPGQGKSTLTQYLAQIQ